MTASAAELAFQVARVAVARDAITRPLGTRVGGVDCPTLAEVVAQLEQAPKPVRITGRLHQNTVILDLGPARLDPDTAARYAVHLHNSAAGRADVPPLVSPDAPDEATVLVVSFDRLLRVSKAAWREFARDFWVDLPTGRTGDRPDTASVRRLGLPAGALAGVAAVVQLGYGHGNQLRVLVAPTAWDTA